MSTLKELQTQPRSLEALAELTGVTIEHLQRLRRSGYGDWPFALQSGGYVLAFGATHFRQLLAITQSSGDQKKIDVLLAIMAAEELKNNSGI